jgi:2-oxoacid:acceptor oxidoreductase gamma subunit (pyruvate/2-ketoisovalerate family)
MLEIRFHGRGGQGAQVACQMLATALFRAGRWVQAFAAYGGERRGAPVTAFLRADDRPIRLRSDIERPHVAVVLDATMLAGLDLPATLRPGGLVLVNAKAPPEVPLPPGGRLVAVDAAAIAERAGLDAIVAPVMLGAFGAVTGQVTLDDLTAAVEELSPSRRRENVEACVQGHLEAAGLEVVGG